jgi:N-acetylmuramoyl-L-alanine amidase CwlA
MFKFKADYSKRQKNFSGSLMNTHEYIIVHHTGTPQGTLEGNIKVLLGETDRDVSAHFLVD